MRVAVAGASGRLGSALVDAIEKRPGTIALPWGRPAFDLDDPDGMRACIETGTPDLVILAAAWTDVDGCARDPDQAMTRNGRAPGIVAEACRAASAGLVLISTNEVFDGGRTDGAGYREDDVAAPRNPYGASKLAGEHAVQRVFGDRRGLWIVRTSWLFGPPGKDFPHKVIAAADRLPPGEALPGVADEHGRPTYTRDLAAAMLDLVERSPGGVFHVANEGSTTRLGWAAQVLTRCRPERPVRAVSREAFPRASDPPPWGILDTTRATSLGVRLRRWQDALDAYVPIQTEAL